VNTKDDPERIRPAPLADVTVESSHLKAMLAPASWNVIRLDVIS
jgi:alpha-N-arabinofuranosidase